MKQGIVTLSRSKVWLFFFGIMLFGALLLCIQDIRFIVVGLGISTFALHELGHLLVLKKRDYNVVGINISIWPPGIGPLPERPINPEDSALLYFSGLISMVIPFFIMYYTLEFGVYLLAGTVLLSVVDFWYWWQLKRSQKYARMHI